MQLSVPRILVMQYQILLSYVTYAEMLESV